ncbi:MAG: D-glycero-beta-D-manno-heptose-7-phosphate kinase [Candidatus Omnitrophica bacterium]|nr:D-glycero-beta-D-manno-heptose-7-phosphate kinase [Candidatus Omnitrophota bacterium]
MKKHLNIINKFKNKKILVVGDLILDQYIRGSVSRISPEAPVPVVLEEESFYTPGGAANVGHNLSSLGASVTQVGKLGDDLQAKILKRELRKKDINVSGIFTDKNIPTVTKTRVIAQHQQIVRIDREKTKDQTSGYVQQRMHNFIKNNISEYDAVIISDYGKGLITPELVQFTCEQALSHEKIITVDPKVEHFSYYRNVTAITPNLKEAENAIRNIKITCRESLLRINSDRLVKDKDIDLAGSELLKCLELDSLLITMSERGMRLFEKGKNPVSIKTKAKEVFDVTGAGDAVISVFTLALTAGATKQQAADLANTAAGIVVGKLGAVAVTRQELIAALKEL